MPDSETIRARLLRLAYTLSDERQMAILGEGNVSARVDAERFLVKASGTSLCALLPEHLVEVRTGPFLDALAGADDLDDDSQHRLLLDGRVSERTLKPSVESLFHAWLLTLPGVSFVGHVHPIACLQILCSPHREAFARRRLIPDQVVYCGAESVLVPYVDPGLALARAIAARVEAFMDRTGRLPRTILLENHGVIGLGASVEETAAALGMLEKSARMFIGAAALGGPVFMPPEEVARIAARSDEHYRRRMLRGPHADAADPDADA